MDPQPPEPPQVRVVVVDDQRPFRLAAAAVLRRTPGFTLVGEARSGEEALVVVPELHPDLVLMDVAMTGINGVETARRLLADRPDLGIVLCSTYGRDDLRLESFGVELPYLPKEELAPDALRRAWDAAHV